MRRRKGILFDKIQTGHNMKYLIEKYHTDLNNIMVKKGNETIPISRLSLREFFMLIKTIPYRKDEKPVEVVARPWYIWKHRDVGMDCKKKAIMIGSYLKLHSLPFRLMTTSNRPNRQIHHIFPQLRIGNNWHNIDATYKWNDMGDVKKVTNFEVI